MESEERKTDSYIQAKDWYLKTFEEVDHASLPAPDKKEDEVSYGNYSLPLTVKQEEMEAFCQLNGITANVLTMGEELEFLNNYIAMMRLRFGNTLTVIQEIDSAFSGYKIIPISIQLLVENAIKHNIVSERHPLTITIKTTPESTLIVSNPLQPKCDTLYEGNPNTEEHTGIGLVNLEQRYQLMFHRGIIINHTEHLFSVEIPLAAQ